MSFNSNNTININTVRAAGTSSSFSHHNNNSSSVHSSAVSDPLASAAASSSRHHHIPVGSSVAGLPVAQALNNVLNPRKRFLNVCAASAAALKRNRSAMEDCPMTSNENDDSVLNNAKRLSVEDADGQLRPNFSALGTTNSIAATVAKTPTNMTTTAKPGDIRKIVIKNFKSEWYFDLKFETIYFR